MYYIISRKTHEVVHKTTDVNELKLFRPEQFEVVIY